MTRLPCPQCGIVVDAETEMLLARLVSVTIRAHDCRPWLRRFFNRDSMHVPPFTR